MISCASILLAAGASTRLGKPKQLLQVGGESLLRRAARIALEAGSSPSLVVLGASAAMVRNELNGLAVQTLINAEWREGVGSSLRCAIHAVLARPSPPGAVLMLVCDQPNVTVELLRALIAQHAGRRDAIVASRYQGILGVPAVFGSAFFTELAALSGDRGARQVIARHAAEASYLDFPGGEFDVDTLADESALRNLFASNA
jgi:molybdenum cofactor cytidylyltransferase